MAIDQGKLMEFLHKFVGDLGATMAAGNVLVGDRLGLYRALAERPMLPHELAERTGTATRYVDEWLRGQAAGGYVEYDPQTRTYSLTPEQAFALTNPDGGIYAPGAFVLALGMLRAVPRMDFTADARLMVFRSGSFSLAISSTCFAVSLPTLLRFGSGEPFTMPAARLISSDAGGVFMMNVNVRSL